MSITEVLCAIVYAASCRVDQEVGWDAVAFRAACRETFGWLRADA